MEVSTPDVLILEPNLQQLADGTVVDIVMQIEFHIPGCTSGFSKIHRQQVVTDCRINGDFPTVTLFRVSKQTIGDKVWLLQTDQTVIAKHAVSSSAQLGNIIETCAGIGAVDVGYEHVGAKIVASSEINPKFANVMLSQGKHVVIGDNSTPEHVASLAPCCPCIVSGGVSCQPFSTLGDRKEGHDNRARSLVGTLKMIHLLQAPVGILECTPVAHQSTWFQSQLAQFCEQTGFEIHQKVLELHHSWPAKRTRWWGVLSKPEIQVSDIPDMPKLEFDPTFFHLFPKLKQLEEYEAAELALDLYELSNFYGQPKGIGPNTVDYYRALPTATHSWGSQLTACSCGCRQSGFKSERISEKGLYGQLIPTQGMTGTQTHKFNNMRHMHAKEVALANGLIPSFVPSEKGNQRLMLAAVGQMASPLQGMWIYTNILANCEKDSDVKQIDPISIMASYVEKLFHERDLLLNIRPEDHNTYMKALQTAWKNLSTQEEKPHGKDIQIAEDPIVAESESTFDQTNAANVSCLGKGKGGGEKMKSIVPPMSQDATADEQLLREVMRCENEIAKINQTDEFQKGGVPGFATRKQSSPPVYEEVIQSNLNTDCGVPEQKIDEGKQSCKRQTFTCEVEIPQAKKIKIQVGEGTKLHQIVEAEVELGTMVQPVTISDTMGMVMRPQVSASEDMHIRLQYGGLTPTKCPKEVANPIPELFHATREELLWKQNGWTAVDEMQFYASFVQNIQPNQVHSCVSLPNDPSGVVAFGQVMLNMMQMSESIQAPIGVCLLADNHWTPICVSTQDGTTRVKTTPMQMHWIRRMYEEAFGETNVEFSSKPIPAVFHADCGFQSIGWVIEALVGDNSMTPIKANQAHEWRKLFHEFLISQGLHDTWVETPLVIGGAQQIQEQLKQLVESHGVAKQRSETCAEELIEALGVSTIFHNPQISQTVG